jgi:pantoate--beta-alanine ligase
MAVISSPSDIRDMVSALKKRGLTVGFVPTMGALHQGHLSLIEKAKKECDHVVVSIFVNPTQFSENEDLSTYPRPIDSDALKLKKLEVDSLFMPRVSDVYPSGISATTRVSVPGLSVLHCAKTRPHFFYGVTQVVAILFNMINPDVAFFGEKDFQQLTIIKKMVADLFMDVAIVGCPIIREPNGLAMSSRNMYLSETQLSEASFIFKMLHEGRRAFASGEKSAAILMEMMRQFLNEKTSIEIDYLSFVDPLSLEARIEDVNPSDRILFAGVLGKTRLIDNMSVS